MPRTKFLETRAVQDFLKTVYLLQNQTDRVSTHRLAEVLAISPPSVTDMALRLSYVLTFCVRAGSASLAARNTPIP